MSSESYVQLLRDPRWQKKRLEIMERDKFRCVQCDEDRETLHVHHTYYEYGKLPWEYPEHTLITFCESCHKVEEENKAHWDREIGRRLRQLGARNIQIEGITWMLENFKHQLPEGAIMGHLYNAIDQSLPLEKRI